jgi:hypothetical protein
MAKKHVKFLVDGKYWLDLWTDDKLPFTLDAGLQDEMTYTKRGGAFSKNFTVPPTKNNMQIADYFGNRGEGGTALDAIVNTSTVDLIGGNPLPTPLSNTVNPTNSTGYKAHVGELIVNGMTIFLGKIQIRTLKTNRTPTDLEFVFYADNGDWVTLLSGLSLRMLNGLSDVSWDGTDILNMQRNGNSNYASWDYQWLPINYGDWGSYWNKTFDAALGNDLINWEDYRPSFRVAAILREIFRSLNYKISSDFINGNFFSRLYMPYCNGDLKTDYGNKCDFRASNPTDILIYNSGVVGSGAQTLSLPDKTTSPNFDGGTNYNTSTSQFTVNKTGIYN